MLFLDRVDAGDQLAQACAILAGTDPVLLGIPRGGVPVAARVADALRAPLDVVVVRKLGAPQNGEFAIGAIGEGVRVVDYEALRVWGVTDEQLAAIERRERAELARRLERFRGGRPAVEVAGRCAVIVDDGIATGATARAACAVVRARGAARIVVAVPVAPPGWSPQPGLDADQLICLHRPRGFMAVGQWYRDFAQTTDDEVRELLAAHRA